VSISENQFVVIHEGKMAEMTSYAQPLRAIGQALEVLNIQNFEMEPVGDDFFVSGQMPVDLLNNPSNAEKLRTIWGTLSSTGDGLDEKDGRRDLAMLSRIELFYTALDVERLEKEGRSRRGNSSQTVDAASLSQVLRCIGAYLNQKRARLCKIMRQIDCLIIEYETSLGSRIKETLTVKDLYDLWVRMYMQRSERASN
jgi:hypothetical protein